MTLYETKVEVWSQKISTHNYIIYIYQSCENWIAVISLFYYYFILFHDFLTLYDDKVIYEAVIFIYFIYKIYKII